MATGDGAIIINGIWATVQADASVPDGAFSTGANTDIKTAIPNEQTNFLLDFRVNVSIGMPIAGGFATIYKRQSVQTSPSVTYLQTPVGNIYFDASQASYYLRGVVNDDPDDTFYIQNQSGATLTIDLSVRGRTYGSEV